MSLDAKTGSAFVSYVDKRLGSHSGAWPEYQWFCPFCLTRRGSESSGRKLRVNAVKGQGMCFRCGYGFKTLEAFFKGLNNGNMTTEEADLIEGEVSAAAIDSLRDELLIKFYATIQKQKPLKPVYLPAEYTPLFGNGNVLKCRPAFTYLRRIRNFKEGLGKFIETHQVGYCLTGDYANRLVFPVIQGGKQVYFTTRYCGDHLLKSKNPKNVIGRFTKETCLLNYDGCVGAKRVYVVEGPLSMAAFKTTCALMGKTLSDEQLMLLETLATHGTEEFVLGTDPDASREAGDVFRRMQSRLPKVSYLRLSGGDPFDVRASIEPFIAARTDRVALSDMLRGLSPKLKRGGMVRY